MKKFLFLILVVAAGWYFLHQPLANWHGMPAADDPLQQFTMVPRSFELDGYTIEPLARYHITAVVLSRDRYRNDRSAALSPVDLALGWGPMSVASVINQLTITQSGRWYEYTWSGDPPLDPNLIATHSANTHCLPANAEIRRQLLDVDRHDLVTMDGVLVEVRTDDGFKWRSSLTRTDTGGGSCEVFWITSLSSQHL